MTLNAKIKNHPDAVFGKDDPSEDVVVMQLVDKLKTADVSAFTPAQQSKLATAIAIAAKRLVEDYSELVKEREGMMEVRTELEVLRLEVEAREAAIQAREVLLGIHPAAPKKSGFTFWR